MSFRERLINIHRDTVKGSLWNRLNVIQTLMILHGAEIIWIAVLIWQNWVFETKLMGSGFTEHWIIHLVCTILALMPFIPGTFWLYLSFPLHLIKLLQPSYVVGIMGGKMSSWFLNHRGARDQDIYDKVLNTALRSGLLSTLISINFKIYLSAAVLWYHLVLERIRSAGGTGCEKKTALELEMEAAGAKEHNTCDMI
ncbi:putative integral membrane protein [Babesia bovis T2Bo]|uniref:putative integral membrane protein n=1 Tax=Babesia bovis T2Bo TaxID=484906 RepID=UPI001C3656E6|nr:putative integral membrane protein [Babesia bovis T2Bo]KAG6440064.1 putative integral membrane protein [Babesia bovis T2Bo]